MQIADMKIPVREIVMGYTDDGDAGCFVYDGKCCARPAYQRNFCYGDKERNAVINTVSRGLRLGVMYWMKNPDGSLEIMDGQQRTLSLCQYINGDFSIDFRYFFNLSQAEKDTILDHELMVYICEGTDKEKLDWFQTINIAGMPLTSQEIRNAVFHGLWCQDAKKYFSKPGGPAFQIADKYLAGSAIRQDYLETALKWICARDNIEIADYMGRHQHDATALELWTYFRSVIDWVDSMFPTYRKRLMKGLPWGIMYNTYGSNTYDPVVLEARIAELEQDEDVTNQKGIYEYVLGGAEKCLNIRNFSEKDKRRKYAEQGGVCPHCGKQFEYEKMDGDHIIPWAKGGRTEYNNLQMLCIGCNRGGK